MIYLSSFKLSNHTFKNPNIYPYNVFRDKYIEPFSFAPITIFYGNNGCGKSTLLNIIAGKLKIKGKEMPASNAYYENYCERFENECAYSLGSNEDGIPFYQLPENSRYIKSEDIFYDSKILNDKMKSNLTDDRVRGVMYYGVMEDFVDHDPHIARGHQRHTVHFRQVVGGVAEDGIDSKDAKNHHAAVPCGTDAQNGKNIA